MAQLSHSQVDFKTKRFPIHVLLDNLTGDANIGSIFRLCDALGVEKLVITGTPPNLEGNRLKRTARNTIKAVDHEIVEDLLSVIENYKKSEFELIALEITESSIPVSKLFRESEKPVALILGNERFGIQEEVLKKCDQHLHIEMFGQNSSMNVAQAAAIALYELTKS